MPSGKSANPFLRANDPRARLRRWLSIKNDGRKFKQKTGGTRNDQDRAPNGGRRRGRRQPCCSVVAHAAQGRCAGCNYGRRSDTAIGPQQLISNFVKIGAGIDADHINKSGGIGGKQIKLELRDEKANPSDATIVARELIRAGVKRQLGVIASPVALAMGSLMQAEGAAEAHAGIQSERSNRVRQVVGGVRHRSIAERKMLAV